MIDGLPYYNFGGRTLRLTTPNATGTDVKVLQTRLAKIEGIDVGAIDGIYGPNTVAGVRTFQHRYGLTEDGVVGSDVYWYLGESTGAYLGGFRKFGTRPLSLGMTGSDVGQLQNRLNAAGYCTGGPATEKFDAATKAAVMKFQGAVGLEQTGIVDDPTYYQIYLMIPWGGRTLRQGLKGSDVRVLQQTLNDVGSKPVVVVDGKFGSTTADSVRYFQNLRGISADGVVGRETYYQFCGEV
jgi:peptidoglycan hydrolase-like protein with peptidoglycan-binding domain